jgi:hypothetical protein
MLKHWTPSFHPFTSTFNKRNLWLTLLDFPIELWSLPVREAIVNTIENFIYFDTHSLRWSNKRASWVLTEIDLSLDLLDSIEVNFGDLSFKQTIDYWREPFCCHLCW